ncbi:amino acid adenylation domain-containing protein [Streptomyces lydicus]|uniref:amino acid adenylation domain-containing protein n=1 Tax=Streptomyces lydicus TaxID=47763 RepID=UPI0037A78982
MSTTPQDITAIGRRLVERRNRPDRPSQPSPVAAGPAPLSPAQEGLWLFEQLFPGTSVNHLTYCGAVDGAMNMQALDAALNTLVQRHDILRTAFPRDPGGPGGPAATADGTPPEAAPAGPRQVVRPDLPLRPLLIDLTDVPARDRETEALRQARLLAAAPFDLSEGPLLRVAVYRLSEDRSLLLVAAHHLIADGWSLGVFLHELAAAYTDPSAAVGQPPLQYADLARRQRQQPVDDRSLHHWQETLRDQEALQLPTDGPRPAARRFCSASVPVSIPAELSGSLRRIAADSGTTPFMVLLAAFQLLLSRMSGQHDVSVGSPVAMSGRAATPRVLGPLVNMLVLRTDLGGEPTFRELLERVRRTCLAAFAHQDVPYEKLVETLRPDQDLSRGPLFQTMLVLQDRPADVRLGELILSPVLLEPHAGQHEAELYLWWDGTQYHGFLGYDTDLFHEDTAHRIVSRFLTLLESAAGGPDRPVGRLAVLDRAEEALITRLSSGTRTDVPERCIHRLVEEQADRVPDAPAVQADDTTLTYRALERRANQLAHHLRAHGVGPESLVGICLDRNSELIVALLAVLKAGGAYVPLDPHYPVDRIRHILQDADAALVITSREQSSRLPATGSERIVLDDHRAALAARPTTRPDVPVTPRHAAYAIYTSGSTGRPKGVIIEHRQTAEMLAWAHRVYSSAQLRNALATTSICFDLSLYEIFAPLTCGGALTLVRGTALDLVTDPGLHGPTLLNTVPSIAQELLHHDALPATATTINLAGEALPPALVDELYRQPQVEAVHNLYGPSEDTTYSTHHRTTPGASQTPIGRPVDNTQAHILDAHLRPVPLGSVGELYLSGRGITRGYHRHPRQTAERYLPNPYGPQGSRLYRTGDLASRRPDGVLCYHGRVDTQIKIHGYRIEPAEIETVLLTHPAVQQAALTTHQQQLHAHLVAPALDGDPRSVKQYLATQLPFHFLPQHYTFHSQLPTTPNHKIDYKALPPPVMSTRVEAHQPPTTATQRLIATHWKALLDTTDPGIHDNFFTQGGHSLLATRLTAHLARATGHQIPLDAIFRHPTLAGIADVLDSAQDERPPAIPRLDRLACPEDGGRTVVPASFGQERLWYLSELDPQAHLAYQMVGGARLHGPLDADAFQEAVNVVVRRHESLRTTLVHREQGVCQLVEAAGTNPVVRHVDLTGDPQPDQRLQELLEAEMCTPLVLGEGALLRVSLVALGPDDHAVVLCVHHGVFDGWSVGVLWRELAACYAALCEGRAVDLPMPVVQYGDFAGWQRDRLSGGAFDGDMAYWRAQLAGVPALELPVDRARPGRQTFAGAAVPVHVGERLSRALDDLSAVEGVTPFMMLLAAFQAFLSRISGQSDVAVGSPVAGRGHPDVEDLIGFFVNTLVLRSDMGGEPSFREALTRVRRVCLDAFAHQDVPFEQLVAELRPQRDMARSPLFQTMLVLNEEERSGFRLQGVDVSRISTPWRWSQFDLSLHLERTTAGLVGELVYNTDLFDQETAERFAEQFLEVLATAVADPDRPVSRLLALSEAEEQRAAQLAAEARRSPLPASAGPAAYRPPVTETQQLIAAIWSEVLAIPHPGIDDDFFVQGGHSLLAGRVVNRLRKATGTAIPLRMILEHPTIAELAARLDRSTDEELSAIPVLPRTPGPDGRYALPASFGQERLWFLSELDPQAHLAYHLVGGARLRGPLDTDALRQALDAVAPRHETLRTTLQHRDGGIEQLVGPPAPTALHYIDLGDRPDPHAALDELLADEVKTPLAFGEGSLLRVSLVVLGPEDYAVVLCVHHGVFDGWSVGVLWEELAVHYAALCEGRVVDLPVPVVQYGDFAGWQRDRLSAGAFEGDMAYWRAQLAGVPVLELPVDRARSGRETFAGGGVPVCVGEGLSRALDELSAVEGVTPFMVVLAAFQVFLSRVSGQSDVAVGSPVAGRGHPDVEGLIGFFVNTLVLRSDMGGEPSFREVLGRVRRVCLDAFAHQDVPFERLVAELRPQREAGRSPLFQAMLVLNEEGSGFRLPGVEVSRISAPWRWSQFDLSLHLERSGAGLVGELVFNTDLFDRGTVERFVEKFVEVLATAVADPARPVSRLLALSEAEERRAAQLADEARQAVLPASAEPVAYRPPVTETQQLIATIWSEVLDIPHPGIDDDFFTQGGHSLLATRLIARISQKTGVQIPLRLIFEHPTIAGLAEVLPAERSAAPSTIPRLQRSLRGGPRPTP